VGGQAQFVKQFVVVYGMLEFGGILNGMGTQHGLGEQLLLVIGTDAFVPDVTTIGKSLKFDAMQYSTVPVAGGFVTEPG
jgi:hypothetical protein